MIESVVALSYVCKRRKLKRHAFARKHGTNEKLFGKQSNTRRDSLVNQ